MYDYSQSSNELLLLQPVQKQTNVFYKPYKTICSITMFSIRDDSTT